MKRFNHPVLLGFGLLAILLVGARAVFASANVSISYSSVMAIPPDSLVSTVIGSPTTVELANTDNAARFVGVAVSTNQGALQANTTNNTQVAVSGVAEISVSTIGGDIHAGDQLSVSSIDGVGMKASSAGHIIGIAAGDFTSNSSDAAAIVENGQAIYLGHIAVNLAITDLSNSQAPPGVLNFLETVGAKVSGHQVSETQAMLSAVVALIAIVATFTLVYGMVRGGLISIGRNPLAKMLIVHSIEELMALIPAIVIIAVAAIYFILR